MNTAAVYAESLPIGMRPYHRGLALRFARRNVSQARGASAVDAVESLDKALWWREVARAIGCAS